MNTKAPAQASATASRGDSHRRGWYIGPVRRAWPSWSYLLPSLLVLVFAGLHWRVTGGPALAVDDAYTTQHNARALLQGTDPNFAEASPLHGSTSAVHLALVAALGVVMPLGLAQFGLTVFAALLYAWGVVRLALGAGAPAWAASLFAVMAVLLGDSPHHLLNGLETGLAMAGITWLLVAMGTPRGRDTVVPLLAGTLPFVRPELAALSALVLFAQALDAEGTAPARARLFATWAVRAALAAAPWLVWCSVETGAPWPPSVEAKRLYFAEWCLPFAQKWELFSPPLLRFGLTVGAPLVGLLFLGKHWRGRAALVFALVLLLANLTQFPTSIDQYEHRYLYVLVPLMLWGLADGAWTTPAPRLRRVMVVVLLAGGLQACVQQPRRFDWHLEVVGALQREAGATVAWMKAHLPPTTRVLVHDVGFISIDTPFPMVDLVGLKTPSSVPVNREAGAEVCGHGQQGVVAGILAFQQHAQVFVMLPTWDSVFQLRDGLEELGFGVTRLDGERGDGTLYRVYGLTAPQQLRH